MADCGPTTFTSTSVLTPHSIYLEWEEVSCTEGYLLEQSVDGVAFTPVLTLGPGILSRTVTGLSPNTEYWFQITTYDKCDTEAVVTGPIETNCVTATTSWGAVAEVEDTDCSIRISWLSPIPPYTPGVIYEVSKNLDGGGFSPLGTTSSFEFLDDLPAPHSAQYAVRMVACGVSGSLTLTASVACSVVETSSSSSSSSTSSSSSA